MWNDLCNTHSIHRHSSIQTYIHTNTKPYLQKLKSKAKVFLLTKIYVSRIKPDCVKRASWCVPQEIQLSCLIWQNVREWTSSRRWNLINIWAKHNNGSRASRLFIKFYCIASTRTGEIHSNWDVFSKSCKSIFGKGSVYMLNKTGNATGLGYINTKKLAIWDDYYTQITSHTTALDVRQVCCLSSRDTCHFTYPYWVDNAT